MITFKLTGLNDSNRGIDFNFTGTAGGYYRWTDDDDDDLNVGVHVEAGYQYEDWADGNQSNSLIVRPGLAVNLPIADILLARLKAFFQFPIVSGLDRPDGTSEERIFNFDDYRVGVELQLRTQIVDNLALTTTGRYTRINNPAEGSDPNEYVLLFGAAFTVE